MLVDNVSLDLEDGLYAVDLINGDFLGADEDSLGLEVLHLSEISITYTK